MCAYRALVVDDETQMTAIVAYALQTDGFETVECHSGHEAWVTFDSQSFDLVILDVMLPDISGITLCKRIRSHSDVPVLMLTALSEVDRRVAGLEAGADDYLAKPFSPRELVLRARALTRRCQGNFHSVSDERQYHRMREDPHSGKVYIDGNYVDVSDLERRLLRVLMSSPGTVFSVRDLLNAVWNTTATTGGPAMVKTSIYRLRKRLADAGVDEGVIVSVRGRGYLTPK